MTDSVKTLLKQSERQALRTAALPLVCVLILGAMNARYAYNVFAGPFKMGPDQLASLKNPRTTMQYYVTVDGTGNSVDTGYKRYSVKKSRYSDKEESREVAGSYFLLPCKSKILAIQTLGDDKKQSYTGELNVIEDDIGTALTKELDESQPGLSSRLYPLMLTETKDFSSVLYLAIIVMLGFAGFAVKLFLKAKKLGGDVYETSFARKLSLYGNPRDLIPAIDNEFERVGPTDTGRGIARVLRTWLILIDNHELTPINFSNLVWVYRSASKSSTNFVTTNKDSLIVRTKDKKTITIGGNGKQVDEIVNLIAQRAPWVHTGYSGKLDLSWQGKPDDFVRGVEAREKEFRSH